MNELNDATLLDTQTKPRTGRKKKLLVCITPQSNSHRLINKGKEVADISGCELHIIHVIKGENLFLNAETTILMQTLFDHGKSLGGTVHGLTGENVVDTIAMFVKKNRFTHVLLGQTNADISVESNGVYLKLMSDVPGLDITILPRGQI